MATDLAAWLLTYALHSTLFLAGAWAFAHLVPERARVLRDAIWKTALVGGILTATLQVATGPGDVTDDSAAGGSPTLSDPARGEYSIRLGLPGFGSGEDPAASGLLRAGAAPSAADLASSGTTGADRKAEAANVDRRNAEPANRGVDAAPAEPRTDTAGTGPASGFARGNRVAAHDGAPDPLPGQIDDSGACSASPSTLSLPRLPLRWGRNSIALPSWLLLSLAAVWSLGALAGAVRIVRGQLELRTLLRGRVPIQSGPLRNMLEHLCRRSHVGESVRLTDCMRVAGPMAVGFHEICVPSRALTELPPAEQRAMLAHELGHLVRRDPLWLGIACVIERLLFFQPLNRLARRRLQEEAEFLCDDWAVAQTGEGMDLARCLAKVAGWTRGLDDVMPASAMAGSATPLVHRVRRLVEGRPARPGRFLRGLGLPAGVALVAAVGLLAPNVRAKVAHRSDVRVIDPSGYAIVSGGHGGSARYQVVTPHPTPVAVRGGVAGYRAWSGATPFAIAPIPPRPPVPPGPPVAPVPPLPHSGQIRPILDSGRYTLRFQNDEGDVDVRIRDGKVRAVRLDGEKLSADRYTVDGDVLTVLDEDGEPFTEVDLDIDRRLRDLDERVREASEQIERITVSAAEFQALAAELGTLSAGWGSTFDDEEMTQLREELAGALAEIPRSMHGLDWYSDEDDSAIEALEEMADELEAELEELRQEIADELDDESDDTSDESSDEGNRSEEEADEFEPDGRDDPEDEDSRDSYEADDDEGDDWNRDRNARERSEDGSWLGSEDAPSSPATWAEDEHGLLYRADESDADADFFVAAAVLDRTAAQRVLARAQREARAGNRVVMRNMIRESQRHDALRETDARRAEVRARLMAALESLERLRGRHPGAIRDREVMRARSFRDAQRQALETLRTQRGLLRSIEQ